MQLSAEQIAKTLASDPKLREEVADMLAKGDKASSIAGKKFVLPEKWRGKIDMPSELSGDFDDYENVEGYLSGNATETEKICSLFNLDYTDKQAVYMSDYIDMGKKSHSDLDVDKLIDSSTDIKEIEKLARNNVVIKFLRGDPKRAFRILSNYDPITDKKINSPPSSPPPVDIPPPSSPPPVDIPPPSSPPLDEKQKIEQALKSALSRSQSANSAIFSSNSARAESKRRELATQQQNDIAKLKKDIEESQDKLLDSHKPIEDAFKESRKKYKKFLDENMLLKGNISSAFAELQNHLYKMRQTFKADNLDVLAKIENQNINPNISTLRKQFDDRLKTMNERTVVCEEYVKLIFKTVQLLTTLPQSGLPSNINNIRMEFITSPIIILRKNAIESIHQTLKNWLSTGNTPATSKSPFLGSWFSRPGAWGRRTVEESILKEPTSTHREYLVNFLLINLSDEVCEIYVAPEVIETAARNVKHYTNKIEETQRQIEATKKATNISKETREDNLEELQKKLKKQQKKKEEQEELLKVLKENNEKYTKLYTLVDKELRQPENLNLIKIINYFCPTELISKKFLIRRSREMAESKKRLKQLIIIDQELDNPTKNTAKKIVCGVDYLCEKIAYIKKDGGVHAAVAEPAPPVVQQ